MDDYWTMHIPVISTAHLTMEIAAEMTALLPGEDLYGLECAVTAFGAFVRFPEDHEALEDTPDLPTCLRDVAVWVIGRQQECAWVRFDRDGDVRDGLPVYDW